MEVRLLTDKDRIEYNQHVTHVIQSWEWGDFRKKIGTPLGRYGMFENGRMVGAFMVTFHKIPGTPYFIGYLPKGPVPDKNLANALVNIGKRNNCIYIKTEPHVTIQQLQQDHLKTDSRFRKSSNEYFTKYNFVVDLDQPLATIKSNFNEQTRRNVKRAEELAEKGLLKVEQRTDDEAFEIYLKLYFETTARQKYHGHNIAYHRRAWESMKGADMARILIASADNEPLTAWMLYNFHDTLYYPYGGSSIAHPELRSNNLVAFTAIKVGQELKLKQFDMWGALGPDAEENHPWFGFHRFKRGYGGNLVEYMGTFDLVVSPSLLNNFAYSIHNLVDQTPWLKFPILKLNETTRKLWTRH